MKLSELYARADNHERANRYAGTPKDLDVHDTLTARFRTIDELRVRGVSTAETSVPLGGSFSYQSGMEDLVADKVSPPTDGDISRSYWKWSRRNANSNADGRFSDRESPPELDINGSKATYQEVPYGFIVQIPNEQIAQSSDLVGFMGELAATLYRSLMLGRERRVLNKLLAAASYASGCTSALSSTNRWDVGMNTSTANPVKDVLITAMSAVGVARQPNTMVIGQLAFDYLRLHERVIAAAGANSSDRVVKIPELEATFGLKQIIVASAKQDNAANHPTTPSYGYIAPKACALIFNDPGAGKFGLTFMKTFRHSKIKFIDIKDDSKGVDGVTTLKLTCADADEIICNDAGYLLDTVIS
jgi:hypothetical protein